jgi:hypothetical protein
VVRHGRAVRRRRRLRGLTGAVALTGAAVAAVALLVPGGQATTARLAAWTVTRNPDSGITVTVNEMKDPGGLEATLRANGIPARVTFDPLRAMNQPLPAGCTAPKMPAPANAQLQNMIPAAIPAGIGLSIGVDVASPSNFGYGVDLVVTSPQCTGS